VRAEVASSAKLVLQASDLHGARRRLNEFNEWLAARREGAPVVVLASG